MFNTRVIAMKKVLVVLAALFLPLNIANSEEMVLEKLVADNDFVISLLMNCKEDAAEDEIADIDMDDYLLTCINDELEMIDYQLISVLPKVDDIPVNVQ